MTMATPSLSIRLPGEVRERLEQAAQRTNRSRSFLVQEALTRHLSDIVTDLGGAAGTTSRMEKLRAMKGAGARIYGPRSEEDIDGQVREFRGYSAPKA
jgi:RHH-type transcriptional regulator, rel operon repressor / antitoxin RelB